MSTGTEVAGPIAGTQSVSLWTRVNSALPLILLLAAVTVLVIQALPQGGGLLIETVIDGLSTGAIFALVALGYTMVYGIIELINFAHGDVFTMGGFIGLTLIGIFGITGAEPVPLMVLGLLGVFTVAMVVTGLLNVAIERVAYRPLRGAPRLAPLITAVGMSFVLEGVMYVWQGPSNVHYAELLPDTDLVLGGVHIPYKDFFVVGVALVLTVALTLFIGQTRLGKAMRATAQDRDASALMGIDINRTISATFFIGAVLAAAGGIILGLYFNTIRFDFGYQYGLYAFTAAVFGGIGNIQGAALGGLFIGLVQAWSNTYGLSLGGDRHLGAEWTGIWIFGILIVVLVFKPTGLLGMQVPEK